MHFPLINLNFLLMKFDYKNTVENLCVYTCKSLFDVDWHYDHYFTLLSYWSKGNNSLQFLHKHFSHRYLLHFLGNGFFFSFYDYLLNSYKCEFTCNCNLTYLILLDVYVIIFVILTTKILSFLVHVIFSTTYIMLLVIFEDLKLLLGELANKIN